MSARVLGTSRLRLRLGPDQDTLICGVTASTYELDFYLPEGTLPFGSFLSGLAAIPTLFLPSSTLTMFHFPPNYGVAITSVSGSETQTQEALRVLDTDGTLLGARNVAVGGTLYDVAFLDGTCADVYGDCAPGSTPSMVNTEAEADAAIYALLEQAFVAPSSWRGVFPVRCGARRRIRACPVAPGRLERVAHQTLPGQRPARATIAYGSDPGS